MRSVSDDADPVLLAHGIAEGSVFYMLLGIVSCTQSKNMSMMLLVAHTYLLQVVGTARCHTTVYEVTASAKRQLSSDSATALPV